MALSIHKLIKLLVSKGFFPKAFYCIYGVCAFVEIISNNTADVYMMYIPSRYNFKISLQEIPNVYNLKEISNDSDSQDIVQKYSRQPSQLDIEDKYENINIPNPNLFQEQNDLENILKQKYNKTIDIEKSTSKNNTDIKCLNRQMERLKYCVQNVDYRLVIIFKSYLCFLHTEEDI